MSREQPPTWRAAPSRQCFPLGSARSVCCVAAARGASERALTRACLRSPLQEEDLRQIFVLTVEVLQEFSRRDSLSAHMSSVFQRYLALANQVLSWNFLPPNHILCPRAPPWC